ncbi:MAG TPA: hypothetical protein VHE99_10055 [Gammaproteobacteria bacterium]|nr:hypothetical protein [Gammaproteobacteria bacterium]
MLEKLVDNMLEISRYRIHSYQRGVGAGVDNYPLFGVLFENKCELLCDTLQTIEALLKGVEEVIHRSPGEIKQIKGEEYPSPEIPAELIKSKENVINKLTPLYRETLSIFLNYKLSLLKDLGLQELKHTSKLFVDKMSRAYRSNFWEEKSKITSLSELSYDKFSEELNKILNELHKKNFENFKKQKLPIDEKVPSKKFR